MTPWGLALLVLGAVAVIAESHVPTLGVIGGPGVIALGAGALLAVAGLGGSLVLGLLAAVLLVVASGGLLTVSWRKASGVRRRRVRAGPERLLGHVGTVRSWCDRTGTVALDGGLWQAQRSLTDEDEDEDEGTRELHPGERVVVEALSGLTVSVRRAEAWEL
jgi:membrane-bound ClpP family serine protease